MVVPQKSSLPITKTGIIRLRQWSSLFSTIKNNHDDAALQSSENRYKESNAGEVPLVSHNQSYVGRLSLIQSLTKIMQKTLQLHNNSITDISPSYLNASLSPDIAPYPNCVQQHTPMPLKRLQTKTGKGRSGCTQSYPCDNREVVSELTQELGPNPSCIYKKNSSSVAQSKYDEFADSVEKMNDGGSSSVARNYSSEDSLEIDEVHKSSNKAELATTRSVSPEYSRKDIESMNNILNSTKFPHSLEDNSEKVVPCTNNLVDPKQNQNKGILKFVPPGTEKGDIFLAFLGWADIVEVKILDDGDVYRLAYIYFKNKEELLKALNRSDLIVRNRTVVLEAASPMENGSKKLPKPLLIGEQTVPSEIIKNTSRTVMMGGFGCDINLRDLRKVLAFCGGNMSGIFFGPSSSSAYVEFETEDDKEMALAKQPVHVMGKQISILRIDTPRTTVVRISYGDMSGQKVSSICTSLGRVKHFNWRCLGIVDVHYCFSEWPKMVEILNSLNGLDIDGNRVLAQPATDYPPDILSILLADRFYSSEP
ncbi:hypothetical protein LIER_09044 [Lithospermum erythrorhizon]|uniref:RRM domain-containing protein n=1 Tax=Lithospermum erythrorhizon TaxID=34254 RepID=A0AAV3PG92_LITER